MKNTQRVCSRKCKVLTAGSLLLLTAGGVGAYLFWQMQDASAKPPVGRRWAASQRVSIDQIDHTAYDRLLKKYVDRDGYVNYDAWKKNPADRQALQAYLSQLGRADLSRPASKAGQLAFWINAYNALTIEGILQVYPTSSIRNHTARFAGYNIWKHLPLIVGDRKFSLNDIEHNILRKMGEPRIHFAIVCASVGCPRLRNEAYVAQKLNEQLADNARDFFSRAKNLRVDAGRRTLYLSSILKWFGGDFGRGESEMLAYLSPYLPPAARSLISAGGVRISYLDYNWNLNDQRSKPNWDRVAR